MLQFDKQLIQFSYVQKSHLKTTLTLTNQSEQFIYYKFKITQPKYYLIKQDKGIIKPKEVLLIDITLHKDGVATAGCDKIKCFYTMHDSEVAEEPQNFERRSDTKTQKLIIKVNGLPLGFEKVPNQMKYSEVKSVQKSQSQFGKSSKTQDSLSLEKQIEQKEQEIVKIKNQMSTIRSTIIKTETSQKTEPLSALLKWAAFGLFVGVFVSFTIY